MSYRFLPMADVLRSFVDVSREVGIRATTKRVSTAFCLTALFCLPVCASMSGMAMQTPQAQSVGTSTSLSVAAQTLSEHFDELLPPGERELTLADLRLLAGWSESDLARGQVGQAARFFVVSPVARRLAGEHGGGTGLTQAGLRQAMKDATNPRLDQVLLEMGKDRAKPLGLDVVLRDPGVHADIHNALVSRLSDDELLQVVGRPVTRGDARDAADETAAFVFLARMSWLGTAEAEAISRYKVPYAMARGDQDHSVSFWGNGQVLLSEKMLTGGTGRVSPDTLKVHIGVYAHESGHAIAHFAGISDLVSKDVKARNLTKGIDSVIGEGIAGVFQNRAHVAAQGFGVDKDTDSNLSFIHDVNKNIASDNAFYAHYYHVDSAAARSQLADIKQVVSDDVVPFFAQQFGLLGDPQLTKDLPPPRR